MIRKAILAALTVFAAVAAGASAATASVYETKERLRGSSAAAERELIVTDGPGGCIELKNGNTASGAKLVLGDCKRRINGFDARRLAGTELVQVYSRKNTTMCMQTEPLAAGTFVRLRKCSSTNKYQKFEWYGVIKAAGDKTLCVSYHGQHADVGDYIKLKKCSEYEIGWSHDAD
jgi:Ricin-type beta-trefoil lectin domain